MVRSRWRNTPPPVGVCFLLEIRGITEISISQPDNLLSSRYNKLSFLCCLCCRILNCPRFQLIPLVLLCDYFSITSLLIWVRLFRSFYCSADTLSLTHLTPTVSWFLKQHLPDSEPGTHFIVHQPLFLRHPICVTFPYISNSQVKFAHYVTPSTSSQRKLEFEGPGVFQEGIHH